MIPSGTFRLPNTSASQSPNLGNESSQSSSVRDDSAVSHTPTNVNTNANGKTAQAKMDAAMMRASLGVALEGGVMSKEISIPTDKDGNKKINISAVMDQYAKDIGSKLTTQQVATYINMGERLVDAIINDKMGADKKLEVQADGVVAKNPFSVESNKDTARAISWYLHAKAVMDNESDARDPVLLKKGSMLMNDPGNKLFKFLNSAPNVYGRASSHYNGLSEAKTASFKNTGFMGAAVGALNRAKAQRGIEDFNKHMPSGKGTVIFDRLSENRLFLKWETAGMPTAFGKGAHADKEEGPLREAQNKVMAVIECFKHSLNFLHTISGKKTDAPWGTRRENVNKGEPAPLFTEFKNIIQDKVVQKEAKIKGLAFMKDQLITVKNAHLQETESPQDAEAEQPRAIKDIDKLIEDIKEFEEKMGNDLGIGRIGAEVHVKLNTDYLRPSMESENSTV